MPAPFIPTTEQVRGGYASDPESEYRDPVNYAAWEQELRQAFDRWLAQHDAAVLAAAEAKLESVRKYADERAWYGRMSRTVSSARIASDLFHILGIGPDDDPRFEQQVTQERRPPVSDNEIHLELDAPTSLHGNGASSFTLTTRDPAEVTCELCLYLWHRNPFQSDEDPHFDNDPDSRSGF